MPYAPTIQLLSRLRDENPDSFDLAEEYHEASKFHRATVARHVHSRRLACDPELLASARLAARALPHLPRLALDSDDLEPARQRMPALVRIPSCRSFSTEGLPLDVLGRLLGLSYGACRDDTATARRRRPIGSGGGLYPLEVYLLLDVEGAGRKGLYHYNVIDHCLEQLCDNVPPAQVQRLSNQSEILQQAPLVIIITALFNRTRFKYGLRGYRLCLLEAGALIHQLQLVAQAQGLGSVACAGLFDDVIEEMLEIDGVDESFLNAVVIGRPQPGQQSGVMTPGSAKRLTYSNITPPKEIPE